MDERVLSALIGAIVVASGWLIGYMRESSGARRLRRQNSLDLQRALHAEVAAHVHQLELVNLTEHKADMVARMRADPDFLVMVPSATHTTIFEALLSDISILPGDVVEPVTLYYSQVISVAALADDIRSERYAMISPDRRAAIYGDFIDMKMESKRMGRIARDVLAASIKQGERAQ
ncbi:MAG: hypothetical protein ACFB03_09220 [Paracoccaceae bacterium]